MARLTRLQVVQAVDLPTKEVEVPEWGGSVLMRGLTAKGRDEYEMNVWNSHSIGPNLDTFDIRAALVEQCIVNDDGTLMFAKGELRTKSGVVLQRLFEIAQELSGIGEEPGKA